MDPLVHGDVLRGHDLHDRGCFLWLHDCDYDFLQLHDYDCGYGFLLLRGHGRGHDLRLRGHGCELT